MADEQRVIELAREVGFDLVGIAPCAPAPDRDRFLAWLDDGCQGSMGWMERDRDRIGDPRRVVPGGRSMLVVGLGHSRAPVELAGGGRVARYAAGRDYHNVAGRMLRKLTRRLTDLGLLGRKRSVVDAGPILERSHAEVAGLGFLSKAANLLHPRFGPWFFLGEIVLEDELAPATPEAPAAGSCGTCTACLDACPTAAITAPGRVDARRCISYLTIEHRGPIPHELRADVGSWVFGCDVCSEVCPWGHDAPDLTARFGVHQAVAEGSLVDWLALGERFPEEMEGSPVRRPGRAGLARNSAIALGNAPSEDGREALRQALESDPEPLVREAAHWGLARGHGEDAGVRAVLEAAASREPDEAARADMRRTQA